MIIPGILFLLGLLCLIKGGDWFVDGASALARRFHLPELLIGATVVSIGTTLPEVMVSTMSAVSGHGEIAYGNAIGSVICNAALIGAVATLPAYRGRGYARACLLALRRDCRAPLLYLCESRNLHSALTALSAGFFRVGTIEKQTVREEKTMSALPFSTVDHVAIIVSDYARSRAFYVDALGFSVVRENYRPDRGDWKLDLRCGDIELELFGRPGSPARVTQPEACGLRHLAFRVPDLDEAVRALAARGIACEPVRTDEFTGKRMTFFADPDGLPLEIRE